MADLNFDKLSIPFSEKVADERGLLSNYWQILFRQIKKHLDPLGAENVVQLNNNQSSEKDIPGLRFNFEQVSQACIDYLIQRVTTGSGAMELIDSGTFRVCYMPGSNKWILQDYNKVESDYFTASTSDICTRASHGFSLGDIANVTTTGSLPGGLIATTNYYVIPITGDTFKLATRLDEAIRGVCVDITSAGSGSHKIQSSPGVLLSISSAGQVRYKSSSITGTASISRIAWRSRTIEAKSSKYSKMAGGGSGK